MWEKFKTLPKQLESVHYEIRGPLLVRANEIEAQGNKVLKLNIGNPASFGFEAPKVFVDRIAEASSKFHGYCDSKGHVVARQAVIDYNHKIGVGLNCNDLNRVYIGNGVSELILLVTRSLLDDGEEILVPTPDYPLWTASVNLAGGKPVHYLCDPDNNWQPDINDIASKINEKTKAIVIINPNNPTGAVYSKETLQQIIDLSKQYGIMILSDEIYDRILYDSAKHTPVASLDDQALVITFNGASKTNRLCGYRLGWAFLTGPFDQAPGFIQSMDKLTSMRLCSVSPYQDLVYDSLFTDFSIYDLTNENGRLYKQRTLCVNEVNKIDGLHCNPVNGALYAFCKIDLDKFNFKDDLDFAFKLLEEEHVLVVHGQGFNWKKGDHFRIVFLPSEDDLRQAITKIKHLCDRYRK